ncbi:MULTISPECIES: hypothetical protein [Bradyrhizobium]|uniref:hypothetical protein n=1 Tax=Bradyrhizobium TaxID=374 RepID=UPI001E5E0C0A|nr:MULTISPECIES: hypothetical protein [Bradyrhizobium]UFW48135.1 hypothetical protein BaraCB756_38705 [Bradyrhizobium arachidis]
MQTAHGLVLGEEEYSSPYVSQYQEHLQRRRYAPNTQRDYPPRRFPLANAWQRSV